MGIDQWWKDTEGTQKVCSHTKSNKKNLAKVLSKNSSTNCVM